MRITEMPLFGGISVPCQPSLLTRMFAFAKAGGAAMVA